MRRVALGVLCAVCGLGVPGAEGRDTPPALAGDPGVRYFAPRDYDGHGQSWSIVQDGRGVLYVGNSGGLLIYDGGSWRRKDLPNESVVRSLAFDDRGRLYVGGRDELGWFERDDQGSLEYHSLLAEVPAEALPLKDVWSIAIAGGHVFFQVNHAILRYEPGRKMTVVRPVRAATRVVRVGDAVVAHTREAGLLKLNGDGLLTPVPGGDALREMRVMFVKPLDRTRWLVGTFEHGVFAYDGNRLTPFGPETAQAFYREVRAYSAAPLADGTFAIGTVSGGIVIAAADGTIANVIDRHAGLRDLSVFTLSVDREGGLWAGMGNGITHLAWPSPLTYFGEARGVPGLVQHVAGYAGRWYVATGHGLFASDSTGPRLTFGPVPDGGLQCWRLLATEAGLLSGCTSGVRTVTPDDRAEVVVNQRAAYEFLRSRRWPDRVYVGLNDGLVVLQLTDGRWRLAGAVPKFRDWVRTIIETDTGALWVGTQYEGLSRITFEGGDVGTSRVERFGRAEGLPKGALVPRVVDGRLLVGNQAGWFAVAGDPFGGGPVSFVPAHDVPAWLAGGRKVLQNLRQDRQGRLWSITERGLAVVPPPATGARHWEGSVTAPLDLSESNGITIIDEIVWVPRQDGLARFDMRAHTAVRAAFSTLVRRVRTLDPEEILYEGVEANGARLVSDGARRSLRFDYAAPTYMAGGTRFESMLEGFDAGWSAPGLETYRVYTNLPGGDYRFRVRARRFDGVEGAEGVVGVSIPKVWHEAAWGRALIGLLLLVGVGLAARAINRYRLAQLESHLKVRTAELAASITALEDQTRKAEAARADAEQASRARAAFLATVSHELRTPMNGVIGMTTLLADTPLDGEQQQCVDAIRTSGESLLAIVNDLLDSSKIDAGRLELSPEPFCVHEAIADVVRLNSARAQEKGLLISTAIDPSVPQVLIGDKTRLRQVMLNLVGNAVKFTAQGHVEVRCAATTPAAGVLTLEVTVVDSGIGIPPDTIARLFQPFSQADPSTTRRFGGTGLGLFICRQLVELMGGQIWVESTPGQGSAFHFTVRLGARDEARPAPSCAPAPAKVRPTPAWLPRILLAEDVKVNQVVALGLLRRLGFSADVVATGVAACAAVAQGYDVILMDVEMPEMDGLEACRRIRADKTLERQPYIVALTAHAFAEARQSCKDAGMDAFLAKPIDSERLDGVLQKVIAMRAPEVLEHAKGA